MKVKKSIMVLLMLLLAAGLSSCKKTEKAPVKTDSQTTPQQQTDKAGTNNITGGLDKALSKAGETVQDVTKKAEGTAAKITGQVKSRLADITLSNQDGLPVKLSSFKGKIVVLEWTNPGCPFVQRHYKVGTMVKLAEQYKDKGVVWLAINSTSNQTQAKNKEWHNRYELTYPILDDENGVLGKLFGAKATPHMFILDKSGKVAYQGAIDDDPQGTKGTKAINYVKVVLDDLLNGRKPTYTKTKPYGCSIKYRN